MFGEDREEGRCERGGEAEVEESLGHHDRGWRAYPVRNLGNTISEDDALVLGEETEEDGGFFERVQLELRINGDDEGRNRSREQTSLCPQVSACRAPSTPFRISRLRGRRSNRRCGLQKTPFRSLEARATSLLGLHRPHLPGYRDRHGFKNRDQGGYRDAAAHLSILTSSKLDISQVIAAI